MHDYNCNVTKIEWLTDVHTVPDEYNDTDDNKDDNHSPSYSSSGSQSCVVTWVVFMFKSYLWRDKISRQ